MNPRPSLLVPMNVTALCVSPQDALWGLKFGRIAHAFEMLQAKPLLGSAVSPKPFEHDLAHPGVHLHWALPQALTRSDPRDGIGFRQCPNRFLVVRLAARAPYAEQPGQPGQAGQLGIIPPEIEKAAWVVESDYLWAEDEQAVREGDARNALSRAVPLPQDRTNLHHKNPFAYQGRVRALNAGWTGFDSRPGQRFTALGYGTETYAAVYDSCRNVFGFYDPPFDAARAPDGLRADHRQLSYLVVGWYSEPGWDPVAQVASSTRFKQQLEALRKNPGSRAPRTFVDDVETQAAAAADALLHDLGWSYDGAGTARAHGNVPVAPHTAQPVRSLFVGHLTGLAWEPEASGATPKAGPMAVALGGTTAEALSALIARTVDPDQAAALEDALNDIQFDLVQEQATAAGQSSRLDALHERDFTPRPAGHGTGVPEGLFVAGDIPDLPAWLARLEHDRDTATKPVSDFLWQTLKSLRPGPVPLARWPDADVLGLLNAVLGSTAVALYDAQRFAHVTLRPETRTLTQQGSAGNRRVRLHRLLLEDTYPQYIDAAENGDGRIWVVQRAGEAMTDAGLPGLADADAADAAAAIGVPLPDDLAATLDELNSAQAAHDALSAAVATRRGQVFADWTTYLAHRHDTVKVILDREIQALDVLIRQLPGHRTRRDQAKGRLKAVLRLPQHARAPRHAASPAVPSYKLASVAAPRFYEPSDPVLLLSGLPESTRPGDGAAADAGGPAPLACRLSDDITKLAVTDPVSPHYAVLASAAAKDHWSAVVPAGWPWRHDLLALCGEACLLNRWLGTALGLPDLARQQEDYLAQPDRLPFQGVAPSRIGFALHAQPWIPVLLQWEVAFAPVCPLIDGFGHPLDYADGWALQNFELSAGQPEITTSAGMPSFSGSGVARCQGSVTLLPRAHTRLLHQIDGLLQRHPLAADSAPSLLQARHTLQAIAARPWATTGQAMTGLHAQLRMRSQTLQMRADVLPPPGVLADPVLKQHYLANLGDTGPVGAAVGAEGDASALHDRSLYHPLRAGALRVRRLRVLDAFGQILDVIDVNRGEGVPVQSDNVVLSSRLRSGPAAWRPFGPAAVLPLRITQPARLSFRYRAAGPASRSPEGNASGPAARDMRSDPGSSPIFGWVMFNRFDQALAIYDHDGRPVGSFHLQGPVWQEAPGPNQGTANPQLRDFLQHLGGGLPVRGDDPERKFRAFLGRLFDTLDHAVAGIEPDAFKQDLGLAVLIGRPLALVRADVRLDLYGTLPAGDGQAGDRLPGLPAVDQSVEALQALQAAQADQVYVEKHRRSANFTQVRFPLRLGDDAKAHDGLLGYFVQGPDAATTYRTFYADAAPSGAGDGVARPPPAAVGHLSLAPADALPASVVMLVDPRATVHARVGILPVKRITLPPAHYADALQRIAATFLVAPVLGGADGVALPVPVPDAAGHAWAWLARQADDALAAQGIAARRWEAQDLVVSPNSRAAFSVGPLRVREGWLQLYPVDPVAPAAEPGAAKKAAAAPTPFDVLVRPDASGQLQLTAGAARLRGDNIAMAEPDVGQRFITHWNDPQDQASWKVRLAAGSWDIHVRRRVVEAGAGAGAPSPAAALQIAVEVGRAEGANLFELRAIDLQHVLQGMPVGNFVAPAAGDYAVRLKVLRGTLHLEDITLVPHS